MYNSSQYCHIMKLRINKEELRVGGRRNIISAVNYTNRGIYDIIFICNRTNKNYRGDRPLRTNSFAYN